MDAAGQQPLGGAGLTFKDEAIAHRLRQQCELFTQFIRRNTER